MCCYGYHVLLGFKSTMCVDRWLLLWFPPGSTGREFSEEEGVDSLEPSSSIVGWLKIMCVLVLMWSKKH